VGDTLRADVAVIGAGIAGLASCVLLRNAGLSVVCLDAQCYPHCKVGESLDWSSPALLAQLGIDPRTLLVDEVATHKKKIVVSELGRPEWRATPPPQIRRAPLRFETDTLHVDRAVLDLRVFERAQALRTTFAWERVTEVLASGDRITRCTTASGCQVDAHWYIDATGAARLFSRRLHIPVTTYGRQKVCFWGYFDTPPLHDGTAFFVDNRDDYLRWIWDIPISPRRTSVGLVLTADEVRDRRSAGESVEQIFRGSLASHSRFDALLARTPVLEVESTSFQPFVTTKVCGANWLIVGEAASMPDPLTGNGVTSGIRHARHASEAIRRAGGGALSPKQQRTYSRHVFRLGHAFNAHIERAIYSSTIRHGLGLQTSTYVYTGFAFFMNALHARFNPRGAVAMAVFGMLFAAARTWIAVWALVAQAALWWRRPALDGHG
jgi:flavin-dependent dehydrogenase